MKSVTILVSALAAFVAAAPAPAPKEVEARTSVVDLSLFNGLGRFGNDNFNYLSGLNGGIDLGLLLALSQQQNFPINQFVGLFNQNVFNVQTLLQYQQLRDFLLLSQLGIFNGLDLAKLQFGQIQWGILGNVGNFGFNGLIDVGLSSQVSAIAAQTFITQTFIKE
jgi:hypothetical protein